MKNNSAAPTVSVSNLTGRRQSGIWLWLKKCICEALRYRPWLNRRTGDSIDLSQTDYSLDMSVIVCTYNRPKQLKDAVLSLIQQTFDRPYEIIIVNNGDAVDKAAFSECENVRIINESRRGLSYARNSGGRIARGKRLVYVDDDIRADEDLLRQIYFAFECHKNIGIVGGQIILRPPEPRPDVILSGHETLWSEYTVGYTKFREVSRQYEFPFGANFSIDHKMFDAIGGFDERYGRVGDNFAGGEETAMCFKALRMGYKIGIEPNAVVYHCVEPSRFTREHIRRTIRAGILTTHRLYIDGYSPSVWDKRYVGDRLSIACAELKRLHKNKASELQIFYKECERDAFEELAEQLKKEA